MPFRFLDSTTYCGYSFDMLCFYPASSSLSFLFCQHMLYVRPQSTPKTYVELRVACIAAAMGYKENPQGPQMGCFYFLFTLMGFRFCHSAQIGPRLHL